MGEHSDAMRQNRLFSKHEEQNDEIPEIYNQDNPDEDSLKNMLLNDL